MLPLFTSNLRGALRIDIVPSVFIRQRAGSTARVVGAATAVANFVFTQNFCPKRETGAVMMRSENPF